MALPNTYYKLDYIQSSGTQYINTNVNLTSSINLKIEFAFTDTSGNQAILGATRDNKQSWVGHNGTNFVVRWGEGTTYYPKPVDTNWHTFEAKDGILYFDDVEIGVYGSAFSGTPLHLFRQDYTSSSIYYYAKAKVRTFEIENTRNYLPAMRKSDSVVGLYDDVNGTFYTNAGSGTFTYGGIVYEISADVNPYGSGTITGAGIYARGTNVSLEATPIGNYAFENWELEDFVELDYIESTGTQYIDTGVVYNSGKIKTIIDISSTQSPGNSYRTILGMYTSSSSGTPYSLWAYGGWNYFYDYVNSARYNFTYDGTRQTITYEVSNRSGSAYNIFIGKANKMGGNATNGLPQMRTYACQMYVDDVFVRNYKPVKRVSTGEVGLFDILNCTFYTNAGSGSFSYGSELGTLRWTSTENPLSLIANSDISFMANFMPTYDITINYDSTLGSASYTWVSATEIELVATPNANAQFKGWYENSVQLSTNLSYIMPILQDTTIEARFEPIYTITDSVSGNGAIQYSRGVDQNDVTFSVIADANNHFVKYVVDGVEYNTTPLFLHLSQDISIVAYFEEDERYIISTKTNFNNGSIYLSDNNVFAGTEVVVWARPFPDYNFVKWDDGSFENPRTIEVNSNITLVAQYQRTFDTNGIYQYRCYVKDQLDLTAPPKAFMIVDNFDVRTDNITNANSTIYIFDMADNINNGDILVVYDPFGNNLYQGVIKSTENNKIVCSQMQSYYKGLWVYNTSPQDYLEHEIAVLLQDYADGKIYKSTYVDSLVAQRLGGITIDYVGTTIANLPSDLDDNGNEKLTQKDMEQFIYSLYEDYGILFDFEINFSGQNYVHIKVPSFAPIKVGNNMYAITNMSPITEIEETNRLIIFAQNKTYRTTYVATKTGIVEEPSGTNNRFDITNTKIVFSDDSEDDLVAQNLPSQMYNHKLTFTLIIKNFIYEFGDFNLGGELEVWHNDDYYDTILTGYQIKKKSNQNITQVDFVCGKVRTALTKQLTRGVI